MSGITAPELTKPARRGSGRCGVRISQQSSAPNTRCSEGLHDPRATRAAAATAAGNLESGAPARAARRRPPWLPRCPRPGNVGRRVDRLRTEMHAWSAATAVTAQQAARRQRLGRLRIPMFAPQRGAVVAVIRSASTAGLVDRRSTRLPVARADNGAAGDEGDSAGRVGGRARGGGARRAGLAWPYRRRHHWPAQWRRGALDRALAGAAERLARGQVTAALRAFEEAERLATHAGDALCRRAGRQRARGVAPLPRGGRTRRDSRPTRAGARARVERRARHRAGHGERREASRRSPGVRRVALELYATAAATAQAAATGGLPARAIANAARPPWRPAAWAEAEVAPSRALAPKPTGWIRRRTA